ncbi:MAG: mannitol dehydrogenase family protein [Planctomycetota bacterium]|jgi:fructuronate reductase|nr:mannitol dehydrogenase family protein [Planctomycetota bacterium]
MKLNQKELANTKAWADAGIKLPLYDRAKVIAVTKTKPTWVHCGAGNLFRIFPAARLQALLDSGIADTGVIVAGSRESIDAVFAPHDNMNLNVTLKADGSIGKEVLGSITEALAFDSAGADWNRLKEIFRAPGLQMVSFTITEKGYSLENGGKPLPDVADDFTAGPAAPKSYIGKVAALLHERFRAGKSPVAMVSMDNCSRNGDRLAAAVRAFAAEWVGAGLVEQGFIDYLDSSVSFPWSMIDKITPSPDEGVRKMLLACGFEDVDAVVTRKNTCVAPFVNAEETEYLIIEDLFPNGRPPLDKAGVIFTDRATVGKVEKMKVCTCLNPLHTALAVYGCLLGFSKISEEMKDRDLRRLVEIIGYDEGLPVVVDPGIITPRDFIDEVVNIRFPNPFVPDTPQRIATDTSQKLPIRFGETIKAYMASPALNVARLRLIPLVHAGWCRYLLGVDDAGREFAVSPDPMLDEVSGRLKGLRPGDKGPFSANLKPILSDARIFGVDLYAVGLGERVEGYFAELMAGPGAVRATLHKYTS